MSCLVLLVTGAAIFALNIPFGYWRGNTRRWSLPWILAIHIPVPVVVLLRLWAGMGWELRCVGPMALCFLAGQYVGGRVRARLAPLAADAGCSLSSWLGRDVAVLVKALARARTMSAGTPP